MFSRRIHLFNGTAARAQGNDAVCHGVEHRLHQRGAVTQCLLCCIFPGNVAKDQYRTNHVIVAITNGRTTVGNVSLAAITGNQYGVIGQTNNGAMLQGLHNRDDGGVAVFLVDDIENVCNGPAVGLRMCPAGELLGNWIEQGHAGLGIGGDYRITNGIECDAELFFAILQSEIRQLKLARCFFLQFK